VGAERRNFEARWAVIPPARRESPLHRGLFVYIYNT
jgi:hypothetical protein